jgi:hypothetical protein
MFRMFRNKQNAEPPTEKQKRYAAHLGIEDWESLSKAELSAALAEAEQNDPALQYQREHINELRREEKFGADLIAQERKWNEFAESVQFMVAVYDHRKMTVVDVLRVIESHITVRGRLRLSVEQPRLINDSNIGGYLDWDKPLELDSGVLRWYEPLHAGFSEEGMTAYKKAVRRGIKIAKTL